MLRLSKKKSNRVGGQCDTLEAVLEVVREGLYKEDRFSQKLERHSKVSRAKPQWGQGNSAVTGEEPRKGSSSFNCNEGTGDGGWREGRH